MPPTDLQLRPFQAEGVEWLRATKRAILADEMGLGKSAQLIRASEGRTLVVAPAMVLQGGTWDDEIAKWADDPSRFTQVAYTSLSQNPAGLADKDKGHLRDEFALEWDTVILDEAHYIKGRPWRNYQGKWKGSQRTAACLELATLTDRLYLATGTPIPNWAHEVFTLLQALDPDATKPGEELGSYWRWVEQWFWVFVDEYGQRNIRDPRQCVAACKQRPPEDPCEHYRAFAEANLKGRYLQRLRDVVLPDLPPMTQVQVKTPMGPKQRREYKRMKAEYLALMEDGTEVVAWSASARHVKLDRLTTGLDLADPDHFEPWNAVAKADNSKLLRLADDLEGRSRPTVVMAHYRDTVEACAQIASLAGLRVDVIHGGVGKGARGARVRAFQAGELDVLVGSLETLAEGLTLTTADLLLLVEVSYKPSRNLQAIRRIHRMGQTRPCTVIDYRTPDTVDTNKRTLLAEKGDHQMRTLTAAQFGALL